MKLKYSALLSDARGTLGGSVATKNRYGSVLRQKTTPYDPKTSRQMRHRTIFSYIAKRWNNISNECRKSWRTYAKMKPYKDIFGDERFLQANALFIQSNINLYYAGLPLIDCPVIENVYFPEEPIEIMPPNPNEWLIIPGDVFLYNPRIILSYSPGCAERDNLDPHDFIFIGQFSEDDVVDGAINVIDLVEEVVGPLNVGEDVTLGVRQVSSGGRTSMLVYTCNKVAELPPVIDLMWTEKIPNTNNVRTFFQGERLTLLLGSEYRLLYNANRGTGECPTEGTGTFHQVTFETMFPEEFTVIQHYPPIPGTCLLVEYYIRRQSDFAILQTLKDYDNPEDYPID